MPDKKRRDKHIFFMHIANLKKTLTAQELKAVTLFHKQTAKCSRGKLINLVLFGSRARGEGDQDSDIDILVVITKQNDRLKTKIWDIAYRLFDKTDIMISPLVLSKEQFDRLLKHERLIARSIQSEGIPL